MGTYEWRVQWRREVPQPGGKIARRLKTKIYQTETSARSLYKILRSESIFPETMGCWSTRPDFGMGDEVNCGECAYCRSEKVFPPMDVSISSRRVGAWE